MKLDRISSIQNLKQKQIMLSNETYDSDGDIQDEGAAEYYGECQEVINALTSKLTDNEVEKIASDLCFKLDYK